MTFFYKASGFFVSFLICALLFWSCKSTNELSSQYLLYDKDLSPAHISAEYCWLGDGTAQLHFTCDSIPSSVMIHDSVSAAISVSQDSIGRALVQHERFVFDSTLQGTVTLHSIDSTKSLHAYIVLQSLFLKQSISVFIHLQRMHECISVYPALDFISEPDSDAQRLKMLLTDTLPAKPFGSAGKSLFGSIERVDLSGLHRNYLYSQREDTLHIPQTFSPLVTDAAYPAIRTINTMYRSLAYIAADLPPFRNDSIARLYIELFWYKSAKKDFTKARELMRIYYNRVQLANEFFTSYKEGWMTDRGMALILLGLADEIQADFSGETWVYYSPGDGEDIQLRFERMLASPAANDLRLERTGLSENILMRCAVNWKKGEVFSFPD